VALDPSEAEGFTVVREVPIPKLPYGETLSCYVVLQYPQDLASCVGKYLAIINVLDIPTVSDVLKGYVLLGILPVLM